VVVRLSGTTVSLLVLLLVATVGCSEAHQAVITSPTTTKQPPTTTELPAPVEPTTAAPLRKHKTRPLPGDLLVADRNNNRVLIVTPSKHIAWMAVGLHGPDDAFFTPGGQSIITNEEFNDTLAEISLRTKRVIWSYGHSGVAGSRPGFLNTPDDAYRLRNGHTVIADIQNCRIVELTHAGRVARILGGRCNHDPPRGFASPNGDTPLADGGLLVTEIGGWIDRLDRRGRLVWSIRSPIAYPSDAQLLPGGRILVAGFTIPGKIVILDRRGHVRWSFGAASGRNMLAKPSLAIQLSNGMIAANDDYNHRVIVIDLRRKRIVWQYGHTGIPGSSRGYLNKPDGIDLAPPGFRAP
jgi:outer membrane protein assembly factor BamB